MTLLELLVLLRKNLRWIVAVPVACAIIAAVYSLVAMRDTYSATTTLYVLVSDDVTEREPYSTLSGNFSVSQQIATDISQLITSTRVRADAAEELGWDTIGNYGIGVASGENSRVVRVVVSGTDSVGVAKVANAVADVTSEVAKEVMGVQSVNVIDRAVEPMIPSGPNRTLYVVGAAFAGFCITFAVIVLAGRLDTRIHDSKEAEEISGIEELGRVPRIEDDGDSRPNEPAVELSVAQDSVKTLLTNLLFLGVDNPIRSIVVTSSVKGEGKSTVACLLAQAVALSGKNVLLVDCDLRHQSLANTLGVRAPSGIGGVLHGESIDKVVRPTRQMGLFLLCAERGIPNPTEVISSKRFMTLVKELEEHFDYVILDAPPLGAFADATVLASLADATLLVVREGFTHKADLSTGVEQLGKAGAPVVGLVVNCGTSGLSSIGYGLSYGRQPSGSGRASIARLAFGGTSRASKSSSRH